MEASHWYSYYKEGTERHYLWISVSTAYLQPFVCRSGRYTALRATMIVSPVIGTRDVALLLKFTWEQFDERHLLGLQLREKLTYWAETLAAGSMGPFVGAFLAIVPRNPTSAETHCALFAVFCR